MSYAFASDYKSSGLDRAVFFFSGRFGYHQKIPTLETPARLDTLQAVSKGSNSSGADSFFAEIKVGAKKQKLTEKRAPSKLRENNRLKKHSF